MYSARFSISASVRPAAIAFMVAFVAERRADSADAVDARRTAAMGHVAERVTDAPAHGAGQIAALGPGFDSV